RRGKGGRCERYRHYCGRKHGHHTHLTRPMKRNHSMKRCNAFSLVEVALSLGLVSFCLLSVIGLLPIGLQSVRSTSDQAAAANAAERIALAIRKATTTD